MKITSGWLLAMIVTMIPAGQAAADSNLPSPQQSAVTTRQNPDLAQIEQLYLEVIPPISESNQTQIEWDKLKGKIKDRLQQEKIETFTEGGAESNVCRLKFEIDMLKPTGQQQYVFCVQASLSKKLDLMREKDKHVTAEVWRTRPTLGMAAAEDVSAGITKSILEQLDIFISQLKVARKNVTANDPIEPNYAAAVEKKAKSKQKSNTVTKMSYKYVSSKNSKVFHKSDCRFALAISKENIVTYNSAEEAIKAGKRPCKRCNPQIE